MTSPQKPNDRQSRFEKIQDIVMEDLSRIKQAQTPFVILNSKEYEPLEVIEERYEKYERFYRPENFQRLGDIELTQKALDVRRKLGHAIEEIRSIVQKRSTNENPALPGDHSGLFVSEDDRAMGGLYFRDALAYIQLGDLNEAYTLLKSAIFYDQTSGLAKAYLGYMTFKRRAYVDNAIDEARQLLTEAASLSPEDCDVFVLRGRFFARMGDVNDLMETINQIEILEPAHPMLDRLQRKANQLKV